MIITGFIYLIYLVLRTVFSVLPSLPPMPTQFATVGDFIIDTIASTAAYINYVLSTPIIVATVGALIAIFNFEKLYQLTMWVIRKIPIGVK